MREEIAEAHSQGLTLAKYRRKLNPPAPKAALRPKERAEQRNLL
jgi:hypothetical protein